MKKQLIVGRGATASATALLLAESGDRVRIVSRGGGGPQHPNIEPVAADALDTAALTELARGAATVFNMAMPAYHTWPQTVPPLFRAIRSAAEQVGADYVMLGNLYGYGPVDGVVTEDAPLAATGPKSAVRAQMWEEAKVAHDAGRLRVTEVRAGQFLGAGAVSPFSIIVQPRVIAGQLAVVPQELDLPHPFTAIADAAAAAVAVARDDRSWGRAWHAPITTTTVRDVATRLAVLSDAPAPRLEVMTDRELAVLGHTDPFWGELFETYYLSHRPYVADDSALRNTFGVAATEVDDVLKGVIG
ncbi:NAD-dependent epimerase [Nocardia sp. NPDC052566]|uniref:NAD-dependent epimerase n=1 Tax=Nocardia sp. NPDC052566 TaxID=3364330 RepID=UPI0037CAD906